jgi:hypothetical protein
MDRKQFLGTLFALPIGIFLVHCSSDSTPSTTASAGATGTGDGGDPNAPAAPPTQSAGMDVYTSSTTSAHSHTFTLDDTNITTPPATDVTGITSVNEAHSHNVTITSAQLTQVSMGQSVEVTTAVAGAHTHVFTFTKIM